MIKFCLCTFSVPLFPFSQIQVNAGYEDKTHYYVNTIGYQDQLVYAPLGRYDHIDDLVAAIQDTVSYLEYSDLT